LTKACQKESLIAARIAAALGRLLESKKLQQ